MTMNTALSNASVSLVLGGARSGKSRYAEKYVSDYESAHSKHTRVTVTYVATATAGDAEMAQRIAQHQADRPAHWQLIEAPLQLASVIENASDHDIVLIDCMTLYLTNWLCRQPSETLNAMSELQQSWRIERDALLVALNSTPARVVIVSNEVGSGIVPLGELSRVFVDEAGWLNQALAELAGDVTLVVAGCPMPLKQPQQARHD